MKHHESWISMNHHESSSLSLTLLVAFASTTYQINLTFSFSQWHVEFIELKAATVNTQPPWKKQRSLDSALEKVIHQKYPFPSQTEGFKKAFLTENAVFLVPLLVPQMETNPPHHASPKDESWRTPDNRFGMAWHFSHIAVWWHGDVLYI